MASDGAGGGTAIELFVYRIARETGALAAALGGLDGFVFTGGIGEHDAAVRAADHANASAGSASSLDADAPANGRISPAGAPVEVWVIPTDEEAVIARQTRTVAGAD